MPDKLSNSNAHLSDGVKLTVIILVFNESLHIERAIRSARRVADDVLVVDSYSTDGTVALASKLGARVIQNEWINHATQMNWALKNGQIHSDWIMRLDADEFLDDQLVTHLNSQLRTACARVGGFEINRRIRFMGREIRYGGMAPMWVTRCWRKDWARCEARWMDEHMVLTRGYVARLPGAVIDQNLNSLTWWTQKHNNYASREAVDILTRQFGIGIRDESNFRLGGQARLKRWLKTELYARLPLGLRPWLYFIYRTVFRLGVLDGSQGMVFHILQGLWYRILVDAKVREVRQLMENESHDVREAIRLVLGVTLDTREDRSAERAAT